MTNDFKASKGGYNKPQLTPEQWAEKKQAEKDAVYKLIDDTAVEVTSSPDKFKAFLDTQARMDRYSAANALLIYKQVPEATQLKDFDDWTKEGVKINKGSKSISILEPVEYTKKDGTPGVSYNVKKVFDVSQTNGKRIPAPTLNRDPQKLVPMMLDSAPVAIETVDELPYDNMGALYDNESQAKSFWENHKTITFNTLTDKQEYEVVAVFKTVAYSQEGFRYYDFVNADTAEDFDDYIAKCKELDLFDTGVNAEYGDKLITLSTCEYSRNNGRLAVVAKLISRQLDTSETA